MSQKTNIVLQLIFSSVCLFLIAVMTISKGFDIPVKSWPWLIGCYITHSLLQGFLYNFTKGLTE